MDLLRGVVKRDRAPAIRCLLSNSQGYLRTIVDILDGLLDPLDPVFRIGMGAEELRRLVAFARGSQDFHHTNQLPRIVA